MSKHASAQVSPEINPPAFKFAFLYPRYWLTWLLLLLFFMLSLLPMRAIDWFGGKLGDVAANKNRKRFHIAKTNLALCFSSKTDAQLNEMVIQNFRAHMRSLLHYGLIWWAPQWRLKKHLVFEGAEHIESYRKQKKNIIALTCHSVGLEFSVMALSMRYKSGGPYKSMRNEVIDWMVARGRTRFDTLIYTREQGMRPLIRNARAGRVLIYLADEDLGAERSIFVPFFGVPKATVPVLGRLSKACDAVVLPCISCYDIRQRKYRVKILPALDPFPEGDDSADSSTMNRTIEQAIMHCPEQYFWALRLFQTRPPGEASLYE